MVSAVALAIRLARLAWRSDGFPYRQCLMTAKPDRERASLRLVYDEEKFALVEHRDEPDFVLQHHGDHLPFGVEVTDLYETESDARAQLHPTYISDLLAVTSIGMTPRSSTLDEDRSPTQTAR